MSQEKAVILSEVEAFAISKDAKIVALRWDLIPWCFVLDCDAPLEEETKDTPTRRVWLIFVGIDAITCPLNDARLPNGIFCTNPMYISNSKDRFVEYVIPMMTPSFLGNEMVGNPHSRMLIKAQRLIAVTSTKSERFGEFGPDRQQRNSLASAEDFLHAIGDIW